MLSSKNKPKLLLHICCAGCGAYVEQVLSREFRVTYFFYNSNIYPKEEYKERQAEVAKIVAKRNIELIVGKYNHQRWLDYIQGLEREPEKGRRCLRCYEERLTYAARQAKELNYKYFASTLTVSPHKLALAINEIGKELAQKYGLKFLARDFKKCDGAKKAALLSRELGLYRQNYCGCEFSIR